MILDSIKKKLSQCQNSFRTTSVSFTLDELEFMSRAVDLYARVDGEVQRISPLAVPEDNLTTELSVENSEMRGKLRRSEREVERLKYFEKALDIIGMVGCENLNHKPHEYHRMGEKCPVEKRISTLLKR